MKWTVLDLPGAEAELAALWLDPSSRVHVTDAANQIDRILRHNADKVGESREEPDQRVLHVSPLGALYCVEPDDRLVEVIHVWKYS